MIIQQNSTCRFQCNQCPYRWKRKLEDYSGLTGKQPCPKCGSLYYTWVNFKNA